MCTGSVKTATKSLFDRLISSQRPAWVTLCISGLLLLAPFAVIALDGLWSDALSKGYWRPLLLPPAVIVYILVCAPFVERSGDAVLSSFRPLVQVDDQQFDRLVAEASRTSPISELVALCVGAGIGLWLSQTWLVEVNTLGLKVYVQVSLSLMFGILGWTIYASVSATRLTAELHRQPLKIDIFDIRPFESIGRQSLVLAVVFIGGIILGLILGLDFENLLFWKTWLIYGPLALVAVLVFFLNMRDTHRVLAREKKRELEIVEKRLQDVRQSIQRSMVENESLGSLAGEFSDLVTYHAHLRVARTWPYNTAMLRTLFFTILVPAVFEWFLGRFVRN